MNTFMFSKINEENHNSLRRKVKFLKNKIDFNQSNFYLIEKEKQKKNKRKGIQGNKFTMLSLIES